MIDLNRAARTRDRLYTIFGWTPRLDQRTICFLRAQAPFTND